MKLHSASLIAIAIFVILLSTAAESEAGDLDLSPYLEVGAMFNTGNSHVAGAGLLVNGRWDLSVTFLGDGTDRYEGTIEQTRIYSVSRIFTPGWLGDRFFIGAGLANVNDKTQRLVGNWNFNLVMGLRFGRRTSTHYRHVSSAGVEEPNTGLDFYMLRLQL